MGRQRFFCHLSLKTQLNCSAELPSAAWGTTVGNPIKELPTPSSPPVTVPAGIAKHKGLSLLSFNQIYSLWSERSSEKSLLEGSNIHSICRERRDHRNDFTLSTVSLTVWGFQASALEIGLSGQVSCCPFPTPTDPCMGRVWCCDRGLEQKWGGWFFVV